MKMIRRDICVRAGMMMAASAGAVPHARSGSRLAYKRRGIAG